MPEKPDTSYQKSSFPFANLPLLQVFDSIDEPIYLCDPETYEVLYANQTLRSLYDVVLRKKCYKLFHNIDSPCSFCTNKFIFGKNVGKAHIWEYHNKVIDRWYHCIDRAVSWTDGKMVRYQMAIDITERKKSEQENIQKAEDLSLLNTLNEAVNRGDTLSDIIRIIGRETRRIFSSNGVTVYLLDEDKKKLILQNITYHKQIVKNIEKIIGMKIPQVKIPLSENSEYLRILDGKKPVIISDENTIIKLTKEHTENQFLKSLVPKIFKILGIKHILVVPIISKGAPFGILDISRKEAFSESDKRRIELLSTHFLTILKRKMVDDALRDSEEHYRILAESANDVIFVINNKNEVQYVNSIGSKLFKKDTEKIIGKKLNELFPDEPAKKFMQSIQEVFSTGKPFNAQSYALFPNKETWLDTNLVPIKDKNNKITAVMGVSRDITERIKAEKEKEEMRDRLFEAEKMKAISVLTSGIAHDINNLLTAIHGFSNIAMDSIDNTLPEYENLDQICQVVLRANKLTDKLLGFSRKHPSEFKAVNINELIEDLKKLLYSFIRSGISITFNLDSNINPIHGDAHKIEQVIMNLVMNAKDVTPEGGVITITTENVILDKKRIKGIPAGRPGQFVCLSVKDTGTGIEKKLQEKIFEPFYTSKPDGKGTGLGLSVVNDIVAQHSGFITVNSRPGAGTEFRIYLPSRLT